MFARLFLLFFLGICFAQNAPIVLAATGINDQISFQGKVVNTSGTNVANGSYDFVFKLYTVSSAGTAVWTETWNSGTSQVTVTDGIFQVNLGTHTDLPGSIDFNTDNIYLGIEFNGDGEMSPRVHFTAAPYAFNAMKVAGLTVTDTTGTLTIPNGETISFGGSFTTTASNDVTLTTSGATNVTLPTTGTLATLAGSEILTNKTIGSTGLTFSGATTDITTASGENLTLEGNGAGVIQFNDASTAAGTMTFSGPSTDITTATDQDLTLLANGAGIINLNDSVTSGALTISGATTDITTGSGESLVLVANGAGVIDLQDATTADSLTLDSGGLTLQNSETIGNGTDDIIAFTGTSGADNTDLFLDLDGTSPVLYSNTDNRVSVEDYLNVQVSGVTGAAAGDIWYDSAANKFKVNESGTTKILCNTTDLGCGSGGASDLQTTYGTDADGGNATISLTTADDSLVFTNPSSSGTDSAFLLQLSQANTTAAVVALDIVQSSNAANGVNITANSIDTETGLSVTSNALTSGSALLLTSSATANFTGSLASINLSDGTGASSNTGSLLTLTNSGTANANTSLIIQHNATGTGNLAFRVNDVASDTTPFVIDGVGNVGIGDVTPDAVLDLDFSQTSGTLFGIEAPSSTTLVGSLIGQSIDLSTNVTATGQTVAGSLLSLPAVTNTGASSYFYSGYAVSPGNLVQNTAAGTTTFRAFSATTPNITQTTGTVTADGLFVSTGSITTGGTQRGINISATGVGAGTLIGANIGAITDGAGTETAIVIGSGWDTYLDTASLDITGAGAITGATGVSTTTLTATSTIDARGDISDSTGNLTLNDAVDISGALAVSGTSLTATSATTITLGSTGADTITIGNGGADTITIGNAASTDVSIVDNNWSVTSAGVGTFITGTVIGSQTFTTNNIADSGALTIASGSGTALTLNSGTTGTINIGTDASAETINIGNTGAAVKTIAIGNNTQANTITIGDSTVTSLSLTENNWSISTTGAASFASATISGALAANGGITFDASTDTVGAFTAAGTIDMSTNIFTNIGNTGTDFVASTGALTLAGVLTANGGIGLAGSQTFTASALSYMDLGAIVHNTTANQGLRLPNAASASPSNPTSGEGYIAWDAAGNQIITYDGAAWTTLSAGGGYNLIKDEATGLAARTTLAFLGAGVSCADNVTQTECTISGGGSSDLQATYGADADGSNVTISLTAADDGLIFTNPTSGGNNLSTFLLQLDQANTTANMLALDIVQASNASNAMNLTANSIDGETGLAITTNGLTSGKGISVTSSSTTATGNLADISLTGSDAANTGNVLAVSNTGTANANTALFVDHRAIGTGNLALRVNDEASDTTPFIIDGDGHVGIGTTSVDTSKNIRNALQIGSATNRSDVSIFGDVKAEGYDIQRSLTGIIDIFVYDTSRDTDSGEWRDSRYSLQNSWATETKDDGLGDPCDIANDDRCGSSAFPRKAILVTTASALYIFDASDNSMWMKFTQAGTYALGADTNNNPSGVGAQNGVVVVGTNGSSATGMYAFDFKQDVMYRYNSTNRVQADTTIGNRNSATSYATNAETNFAILDSVVNDVSIALQTGSNEGAAGTLIAPIDSQAGPVRGVTLIAAATDTGVSVVHMARREVFSYSDATGNDYNQVVVTSRGRMYATNEALAQLEEWKNIDRDLASETNGTPDRVYDETIGRSPITLGTAPTVSTSPGALAVIERASGAREASAAGQIDSGDIVYVGTNQGLAEVHTSGGALVAASWSKITTTTVATPYMNGAVRSAFLFDDAVGSTTATSAVGPTANVLDTAGATSPTFGNSGVRGNSVNFGNNSYLCSDANTDGTCDADTDYNVAATSFSINLWFKHGTTAALDTLFERCYTPATPTATVCVWGGMTSTGAIAFGIDDDTTWTLGTSMDDLVTSPALYNDNLWHHAVFTNSDTDICLYIDGAQAGCDTSLAATATLDASQVVTVGGTCSGANCATGTNLWDGSIDDLTWNASAGTTAGGLTAQSVNRLYLDGRAHLIRPAATITDATVGTSTTIGDSGESYVPGSFVGLVVELTGGTGSGQTRTIIANDETTFTVYPAFTVTPDTTTDYRVSPAKLFGSTNTVTAIGIDAPVSLNRVRKMYVGTNNGSDGGAISVFTNAGSGSIKTEVIHSDAGYEDDNLGSSWSGTDADDITAIGSYSDTIALGTGAFFRAQRKDITLKQLQTDMIGSFEDIRHQLVASGLFGATQDVLGLGQGADLAENYYSAESLNAGEIVSLDAKREAGIRRSSGTYQRDIIGVVATKPAIVMGDHQEDAYPVALVGRVPVRVTNENGPIYAGDRIAAAMRPGYGMFASQAGRVIGVALADAGDWVTCEGEDPLAEVPKLCTTVLVFVNLTDYYGKPIELAMAERAKSAGLATSTATDTEVGLVGEENVVRLAAAEPTREERIMQFLREVRDEKAKYTSQSSEIFTDRVAASTEIITPKLVVDELFAKSIKADSIEGLSLWTDRIASLQARYAGLVPETENGGVTPAEAALGTERTLLNLEQFVVGTFTARLDANILGRLSVTGALTVADAAEFQGETMFARLATFMNEVLFRGKVAFEKVPMFSADTAGFATITEGEKRVRVTFDEAYARQPIVAVTLTRDISPLLEDGMDDTLRSDVAEVEREYVKGVFDADVRYIVTEKDQTGFTILLSDQAPADLSFSWVAIAVDRPRTSVSHSEEEREEKLPEEDLIVPSETSVAPGAETPPVPESTPLLIEEAPVVTPSEGVTATAPEPGTI